MRVFKERRVRLKPIQIVTTNIDRFMTEGKGERPWQVFELTQAENVQEWIENPKKISRIQPNLENLSKYLAALPRPVRVLDVGCYGGYLYDYLARYVFEDLSEFYYVGIDIQESAIEAARQEHVSHKNAEFFVGDIFKIQQDFKPNSFDVVCCYRVLIHIPFLEEAIKNLYHVAAFLVHATLRIGKKDYCTKYEETDLDSGKRVTYFIRIASEESLRNIAKKLGAKYRIIPAKHYTTLVLMKGFQPKVSERLLYHLSKFFSLQTS